MSRYVRKKYQGVVFFTVLVFFQLITILGLYILQSNFLTKKLNSTYWQHYVLLSIANERLQFIESMELTEFDACQIELTSQFDLLSKTLDWWENHGCKGRIEEKSYYYVIELLNDMGCIKWNNLGKPIKHFRITLLVNSKNKVIREILQSVVIKLDNAMHDCVDDYYQVYLGRQSLRRF